MAITAVAPRGGIVETIDGASKVLLLRNREIERFEDAHRGVFEVWDGFFGRGTKPSSKEVRDLIALGLVGGGCKDADADDLVEQAGPEALLQYYQIAQALLGVAFMPDTVTEAEVKKKDNKAEETQRDLRSVS